MSIKPRVILLGPSAERYKGGIAQFTSRLAEELSHLTELKFFSWYQLYPAFLLKREFRDEISKVRPGQSAEFVLGYMNPLSWCRFLRRLNAFQPKLLIATWSHPVHAPIYILLFPFVRWGFRIKILLICHNIDPHESFPGARAMTKAVIGLVDGIAVHSRSEELAARKVTSRAQIKSLFMPIFDLFPAPGVSPQATQKLRLLFFGMVRDYKGLDLLLEALSIVKAKEPSITLRVSGEQFYNRTGSGEPPPRSEDPERIVKELGLEKFVSLDLRYVPNEDLPGIFEQADVVVFPFRSATQSASLALAYAYGKPVIATNVGGLPDMVEEGRSGYLCDPNPNSIAEAIFKFQAHPLSASVVSEVAQKFSWSRYAEELIRD